MNKNLQSFNFKMLIGTFHIVNSVTSSIIFFILWNMIGSGKNRQRKNDRQTAHLCYRQCDDLF